MDFTRSRVARHCRSASTSTSGAKTAHVAPASRRRVKRAARSSGTGPAQLTAPAATCRATRCGDRVPQVDRRADARARPRFVSSLPAPNQIGIVSRSARAASAISARRSSALARRNVVGLVLRGRQLVARAERRRSRATGATRSSVGDCSTRCARPDQSDARHERSDHESCRRATAASSAKGASDGRVGEPMGQRWS